MRNASWLPVLFALGCSAASEPDASTSSDVVETQAAPYREIDRVFDRLQAADLTGCRRTFRFLDGNWIDCVVDLNASYPAHLLQEISHDTLPTRSFSFPTEEADVSLEMRVEESTTWSPLPRTRLFVTATYQKVGEPTIHKMPADHYTYARFVAALSMAFAELSNDDTYASRMFALSGPGFEHPLAMDRILGDIFVGRRTVELDPAACKRSYYDGMSDSWPDPDHWISYCEVKTGGSRDALPLAKEYWSARLATLAKTDPVILPMTDVGERPGTTPTVTIGYGDGGYVIGFAVIDDASGEPEDASIPWERAERWLSKALEQVHEVTWPLLIKETELGTMLPGERIEGRLVRRRGKMDVE
jgi:hypothetical protein